MTVGRCVWAAAVAATAASAAEPNPPTWPSTVRVFGPESSVSDIETVVRAAYTVNGGQVPEDHGQFSKNRYAFLFKPGKYNVEVPVGYYTTVSGLGTHPSDVVFTSEKGVYCEESSFSVSPGALDTFWRGAENFQTDATYKWNSNGLNGMLWAASQAASLRRIIVKNSLQLYEYKSGDQAAGFASGGFMANLEVGGTVASGSQQQFLARHSKVNTWADGVWNMVFVGVEGAPKSHCGANVSLCSHPYTTVDASRTISEKPFISFDPTTGLYSLNVPAVSDSRTGVDFTTAKQIDFSEVYVASDADTAADINAKLSEGLHIIMSPGIYHLEESLVLNHDNQVLLGLGMATLIAAGGQPAIVVGNVDGVRVAGVLLQAGVNPTETLLQWGDGTYAGNAKNPGIFHDLFARVGGPAETSGQPQAKVMVTVNSGHVVGDNMWLWRADHTETGLVVGGANPNHHALVVNGDDVTMYGLKAEHSLQDLVQWNGERGTTYFFQAEFPYDVTQATYGDMGYVAYRVKDTIQEHSAYGLGVYHFFRDDAVTVDSAISVPAAVEGSIIAPLSVFLNGHGTVKHIINDKGEATQQPGGAGAMPRWYCQAQASARSFIGGTCKVGDPVVCPGTTIGCQGNTCCPDGSTCPSAMTDFHCCPKDKIEDCVSPSPSPSPTPSPAPTPSPSPTPTPTPSPSPSPAPTPTPTPTPTPSPSPSPSPSPAPGPSCKVGDTVTCPGSSVPCGGNQCCPDGSTCPSASGSFAGCPSAKTQDCTKATVWVQFAEMLDAAEEIQVIV